MFDIRLATDDDIEESARVLAAAYTEDEQDLYLFPRLQDFPDRYVNTKKSILRQGFSDPTCFTYVATEMVEPDKRPKIVGVCIWYRDDEGAIEPRKTWLAKSIQSLQSSFSESRQFLEDLTNPMCSAMNGWHMARTCAHSSAKSYVPGYNPDENLESLGIMDIAVHPGFQKRGIASALVERGLAEATRLKLPVELCATPRGSILYKKLGFKVIGWWIWSPEMLRTRKGWEMLRWDSPEINDQQRDSNAP